MALLWFPSINLYSSFVSYILWNLILFAYILLASYGRMPHTCIRHFVSCFDSFTALSAANISLIEPYFIQVCSKWKTFREWLCKYSARILSFDSSFFQTSPFVKVLQCLFLGNFPKYSLCIFKNHTAVSEPILRVDDHVLAHHQLSRFLWFRISSDYRVQFVPVGWFLPVLHGIPGSSWCHFWEY